MQHSDGILQFTDLVTGYGSHAVGRGLSASLQAGSVTALLAPNGAGKSTLLRTLAGLQKPLGGTIRWCCRDIRAYTPRELAACVSVVLTSVPDADALTAEEVVLTGRIPHTSLFVRTSEADAAVVQSAMQRTHTAHLARRPIRSLSDGERQRTFIAKALAQQARAILLDEPTAFLDFPSKISTLQLLSAIARSERKAVLISTHDVELALRFADALWLLGPREIICGEPRLLAKAGEIGKFFAADGLRFDAREMRFRIETETN